MTAKSRFWNPLEKTLILKVDKWFRDAISRQNYTEVVFASHDKALEIAKIYGISTRHVFSLRKESGVKSVGRKSQRLEYKNKIR